MKQTNTETKLLQFEEIHHNALKLTDEEYKIIGSQAEMDFFYQKINEKNKSPRKTPIPSYSDLEMYIVLQPKIGQSDFVVDEVLESNKKLIVKIKPYQSTNNIENAMCIIKINNDDKINYTLLELKK